MLLGCSAAEINCDRVGAARQLAATTGAVVLLKGAASVTADPGGYAIVNPTGGPVLAAGGTGDVLLGMLAAYLAQGIACREAAALAAWVHGAAGDRLSQEGGASGWLASEIADAVPAAVEALRRRPAEADVPDVALAGVGLAVPLRDD